MNYLLIGFCAQKEIYREIVFAISDKEARKLAKPMFHVEHLACFSECSDIYKEEVNKILT